MKILVMGLPGSGKSYLSWRLSKHLACAYFNADDMRKCANDWSFDPEARIRQAYRMRNVADFESQLGSSVICDFVCPTDQTRKIFEPDILIWMNTIEEGRFEDTNKMFEPPQRPDFVIKTLMSEDEIKGFALMLKEECNV